MSRMCGAILVAGMLLATGCSQPVGGGQARLSGDRWTPLFNGRDLTGWQPEGNARWSVQEGCIVGTQGENYAPGDLFTTDSYSDFELEATYRVEWPANTGIWFRYQSAGKAYQADILDWPNPVAFSGTLYCPGKMFLAINADKNLENRSGWNTMKVRAVGDHVQTWINDHPVANVHDKTTDSGRIGFQVHPGKQFGPMKVHIRSIRVRLAREDR